MSREEFKARTKAYALRVVRVVDALPRDNVSRTLGNQLLRSGTAVGANYRSAVRGRSTGDFISRMGIVEEECDESLYWLELLIDAGRIKAARLKNLMQEGGEILAITVASIRTARRGQRRANP
jgi:four helix bundle protein